MAKKRKPDFEYAETFDRLMGEQFPDTTFETIYELFSMGYATYRVVDGENYKPITKTQALYGRGLSSGMAAYKDYCHE